ncbi:MAG: hypothetical protein Q7U08_05780, partial [Flavobacteriaceae bacterium]|nr:hypothetical protein [Flavobacteriaceae bacterium]
MNKNHLLYILFILLFTASCSNTKFLPDGELLYTGAKVKMESSGTLKKEHKALKPQLEQLIRPKPNSKILGLRPKLFLYNIAGTPKKEKGLRHWLKFKVGEPPILYSQVDLEYSKSVLQNFAENNGYFNTQTSAVSTINGKRARAVYTVKPAKQYTIRKLIFPDDSSHVVKAVFATKTESLLKMNDAYNLNTIKAERIRIDSKLKENGFF